ncbi:uncharacterized protein CLUP02_13571 [Colletotrichum lupini]|uniref:Uncharacterized protein n=1 Tax=Colletotrichum lupini TaxID=145971 RepID=A0A9Q8T2E8_9PEZI|nr:uncharacterized protein CLUP02_13571 [Colletotrichum lupini]UQC88049.1 hypothetical protein CLUP02_13571 [Colletotrichum lupini]
MWAAPGSKKELRWLPIDGKGVVSLPDLSEDFACAVVASRRSDGPIDLLKGSGGSFQCGQAWQGSSQFVTALQCSNPVIPIASLLTPTPKPPPTVHISAYKQASSI